MTSSESYLNGTKIERVNTKFATSILTECLTKLALLQSVERTHNHSDDEFSTSTTSKFGTDVTNMMCTLKKVVSDLKDHQKFTDFSGIEIAENEVNFLVEYNSNRSKLKEQCDALVELEANIAKCRVPISTVDENILRCAVQNRFFKTWEKARRDQNDHFNRMLIAGIENEIDHYSTKIEVEKGCIIGIETYSLAEMEFHKAEISRWSDKYDVDLNRTEIDIQVAMAGLEGTKMNYEKMVDAIKFRKQEMIDFVALKEERALQKDSDLMKLIYEHKDHLFAKCKIFTELI